MNQDLLDRILELLGKTPADPLCHRFLTDLGESPIVGIGSYQFLNHGFCLQTCGSVFAFVFLHISTKATKAGQVKMFSAALPRDVLPTDNRRIVEAKLGPDIVKSSPQESVFHLSGILVHVDFDTDKNQIASIVITPDELGSSEALKESLGRQLAKERGDMPDCKDSNEGRRRVIRGKHSR